MLPLLAHAVRVESLTPKRLTKIRAALGLTQEKLAPLLGCSWVSVCRWEKGHSAPLPAVGDIYRALDAALQAGYSASKIVEASRAGRGGFLQQLFTMAYMPKARAK